jgi:hypothetical protein
MGQLAALRDVFGVRYNGHILYMCVCAHLKRGFQNAYSFDCKMLCRNMKHSFCTQHKVPLQFAAFQIAHILSNSPSHLSALCCVMLYCHLFSRWQVPLAADRGAAGAQPGVQRSVPAVQVQNNASSDTPGGGQLTCQRADHR